LAGNWYFYDSDIYFVGIDIEQVSAVKESGVSMNAAASIAGISNGEFFFQYPNLYISPFNPGENPNISRKIYIAYRWVGFSDARGIEDNGYTVPVSFPIQGQPEAPYLPYLSINTPLITGFNELFRQRVRYDLGSVGIVNGAYAYRNISPAIWHNATAVTKSGYGTDYNDYETIYVGCLKDPVVSDNGLNLQYSSLQTRDLSKIPKDFFTKSDYMDIDAANLTKIKPILIGEKPGIIPYLVDIFSNTYLISQTNFLINNIPVNFPLQQVIEILKDNAPLTESVDYTVNLQNGTFTLFENPGDSEIIVTARGIKIEYNFTTNTFTGNYSENLAHWIIFILRVLENVSLQSIDTQSLELLSSSISAPICEYLTDQIETAQYFITLQQTGFFTFLVDGNGKYYVKAFDSVGEPDWTVTEYDLLGNLVVRQVTESVSSIVNLKYNRAPQSSDYRLFTYENQDAKTIYQSQWARDFETILKNEDDARDFAEEYSLLSKTPDSEATLVLGEKYKQIKPGDRIRLSYKVRDDRDRELLVYSNADLVCKNVKRDINRGIYTVTTLKNYVTASGYGITTESSAFFISTEDGEVLITE
jgi:hypothetical protein